MIYSMFKMIKPYLTGKAISIFLLCIFIVSISCSAQSGISGMVVDGSNKPIANANVLLLSSKDSSLVKGIISGEDGSFIFENIPAGMYLVTSTFTGLKQIYSPSFSIGDKIGINLGKLALTESAAELNAVTIISKKPMYEKKPDRLVINVQNSITSAGSTALDVLEHSPGVIVDRQNSSISIKGKDGVAIMINGKINYMPIAAAIELLQGMSSGNIDKIELITVPPANLDAEGNAGYINIVLKSNDHFGTNGSYSATAGYGNGLVSNANINFNHRKGKINIYGNLSYARVAKPLPIYLYTRVSNNGNIQESNFIGGRVDTTRNINSRIGLDYQVSKKTVLGILVSGYDNKYTQAENNDVLISKNNLPDTIVKQSNYELNHWKSISANLNMQHDFREGNKLAVNFDYIYYNNNQPFHYHTSYYNNSKDFIYDDRKISTKSTPIGFWIGALDYSQKLGKKLVMETGVKGTVANFYNDLGVERLNQGILIIDSSLSAKYKLNENYTAAYASFDLAIDKNNKAKMGLRYEYTNSNLRDGNNNNIVDRHYGNLFPVVILSHIFNENNSINLSYNMRIARPTFNNLAPYVYYINDNTLMTGNPALQPSISNTVAVDYTFKKYIFSLSLSNQDNSIAIFQPTADSVANKIIMRPENLDNQKLVSAMITVPVDINNWWNMQYSLLGVWQQVTAFGINPLKAAYAHFNINATETFRLPKNISVELSGFYQSSSLEGVYIQKSYGAFNIGIKKKLTGTKGAFIFSVSNILNSEDKILTVDHPERNLVTNLHIAFTQRTFKLTYSRSFGNNKLKEKRERDTGAEDEKGRVQ